MENSDYKREKILFKISNLNTKGICLCLIVLAVLESFYQIPGGNMNLIIARIFGYIAFGNYNTFLSSITLFLLPQLGILLVWGNYFDSNILENSDIIFTRTRKTGRIIWKYVLELVLGTTAMTVMLEALVCILYGIKGYIPENISGLLMDLLLYAAYTNLIVLTVNVISIVARIMYSILIVMSLQLAALQCIYMVQGTSYYNDIYYAIPSAAAMLYKNQNISNSTKIVWLAYMAVIMILLGTAVCFVVKKKEFIK